MKHLRTLRARFALWTACLLLVALTLFGIFVYLRMAQSLADGVDQRLRLATSQVAAEVDVQNGAAVPAAEFMQELAKTPLLEQGFSFRVLNRAGQTIQAYGAHQTLPPPPRNFEQQDQPGVFSTIAASATQQPVRLYTASIIEEDQVIGTIQVAQTLNNMRQTLNQLLASLLIGGPLLAVLAGVGGYWLAARALAPIDKITRTARYISAQDLTARLNLPPTDDEAGRLAATFDSMLVRLDEAFQRERRCTADAAHELRTPLAVMQTILSSTLARPRTPAQYAEVLTDLGEETQRLHTLIEGLLHLTRSDTTQPSIKERVNLSLLLTDVSDSLRLLAEAKGLRLTATVADNLTLRGDSDGLLRLFVNLLDNAIQYTEGGEITVVAGAQPNGLIEISITDTGVGIAAAHLPHLFERFYRVDQARTRAGAGLGLAIALRIAQAHSGTIQVASELGKGTIFTVQLAQI